MLGMENTTHTEQDQTYNGWTNYATWGVALVLDNDEGTYGYVRERLTELRARKVPEHLQDISTPEQHALYQFADFLKDYTEELCGLEAGEDSLSLMARQVIQAGLADVDWREIAENIASES